MILNASPAFIPVKSPTVLFCCPFAVNIKKLVNNVNPIILFFNKFMVSGFSLFLEYDV